MSASIREKAQLLVDWAKKWDGFDGYLKLNALTNQENDASLNVIANDKIIEQFIDGVAKREFTAQFKLRLSWSDGFDEVNQQAMNYASSLMDWVDDQYPKNLPEWGVDIYEITTIENVPTMDFVDTQDSLAEYSFQVLIRYEE